jgi:hypothetical protein
MYKGRHALALVLLWALFIFATSSFFIGRESWLEFIKRLGLGAGFNRAFGEFWTDYGIFVVKGYHALEFAVLFVLAAGLLLQTTRLSVTGASRTAFIVSVAYAAFDEWRQTFVRGRDGTARDVIIDAAGALVAMVVFQMWARRRRRSDSLATTSLANKWKA